MLWDVGLAFIYVFFLNVDKVDWNVNKFKKSDNIKKFHKSYTIRLFLFFHRFSKKKKLQYFD